MKATESTVAFFHEYSRYLFHACFAGNFPLPSGNGFQ
jgi:hypothetical protein